MRCIHALLMKQLLSYINYLAIFAVENHTLDSNECYSLEYTRYILSIFKLWKIIRI